MSWMTSLILILLIFTSFLCLDALKPVVLVPGLGGSQLEAKLNKTNSSHFYCSKSSDWYTIWLSLLQLQIGECMVENLKLFINITDGTTHNQEGVKIRAPLFGQTDSVEWLDPFHPYGTQKYFAYFVKMVDMLRKMSYVSNMSVRGAPYDFRKAPNEMEEFLGNLTSLIEETYRINNNSRVVLMGHSMGNNYVLYLLNHKTAQWKRKYIEAFISIAAPWAGSVKTLRLIASGDSLGMSTHIIRPLQARPMQQTMPSTFWLMPSNTFWNKDEVIVMAPDRNYTVNDYDDLLKDINFKSGIAVRRNTEHLIKRLESPGVKTFCLYGLNMIHDTPTVFDYRKSKSKPWYDTQPVTIDGPGDSTVNERSLMACKGWKDTTVAEFNNADHLGILSDSRVIDYIENLLLKL